MKNIKEDLSLKTKKGFSTLILSAGFATHGFSTLMSKRVASKHVMPSTQNNPT